MTSWAEHSTNPFGPEKWIKPIVGQGGPQFKRSDPPETARPDNT